MIEIISSRNLLQVAGEWPTMKLTAEFHVEAGTIKRIGVGNIILKPNNIHIGSFNAEENGSFNMNIYNGGMDNYEAVCEAIKALIKDVKTQITE